VPLTRVIAVDPARPDRTALDEAAAIVRAGGLVAFPTESFYGLGADALDPAAVERVCRAKGRPSDKPILALVGSPDMAERLTRGISPAVRDLMARHWPGPLTIVLAAAPEVPAGLTAGSGTIGLRMPGHAIALGLVEATGRPVTAPSANPSGAPPPTTAAAVRRYFDDEVDLILDGGTTGGGTGSTVADCTVWPPRVLRAGPVALG
jgi:L-threonylcarbamoyladenylate synthase